jgi:acetyl esterase/lipase
MKNQIKIFTIFILISSILLAGCNYRLSNNLTMTTNKNIPYIVIAGVDPNLLSLDVYAPAKAKDLPVVLMIHGGGWANGDKANRDVGTNKARYFTAQGYVYVSINYRLSPAVQHPTHIEDVASAVSWVLENIATYGGDPARLTLMGHSAGAHLLLVSAPDWRDSTEPCGFRVLRIPRSSALNTQRVPEEAYHPGDGRGECGHPSV